MGQVLAWAGICYIFFGPYLFSFLFFSPNSVCPYCWRSSPLVFLVLVYKTLIPLFSLLIFPAPHSHLSSSIQLLLFCSSPQKFQLLILVLRKGKLFFLRMGKGKLGCSWFLFLGCVSNLKKLL